jgi:hypothetical protein
MPSILPANGAAFDMDDTVGGEGVESARRSTGRFLANHRRTKDAKKPVPVRRDPQDRGNHVGTIPRDGAARHKGAAGASA